MRKKVLKEKNCEYQRRYREKYPEIIKKRAREWAKKKRDENPEKFRKYQRERRRKNQEAFRKYSREYYQKNREHKLSQKKEYGRKIREEVIKMYGGKCECCGESHYEFLVLDHRNGGGNKERKEKSVMQIYRDALKEYNPVKYRILCHNCNSSYAYYGYCPHNLNKRKE